MLLLGKFDVISTWFMNNLREKGVSFNDFKLGFRIRFDSHKRADLFVGRSTSETSAAAVVGARIKIRVAIDFAAFGNPAIWYFATFYKYRGFLRAGRGAAIDATHHALL